MAGSVAGSFRASGLPEDKRWWLVGSIRNIQARGEKGSSTPVTNPGCVSAEGCHVVIALDKGGRKGLLGYQGL